MKSFLKECLVAADEFLMGFLLIVVFSTFGMSFGFVATGQDVTKASASIELYFNQYLVMCAILAVLYFAAKQIVRHFTKYFKREDSLS